MDLDEELIGVPLGHPSPDTTMQGNIVLNDTGGTVFDLWLPDPIALETSPAPGYRDRQGGTVFDFWLPDPIALEASPAPGYRDRTPHQAGRSPFSDAWKVSGFPHFVGLQQRPRHQHHIRVYRQCLPRQTE